MTYYPFEFNKNVFLIVCSNETMNISVSRYPSLELKMQIPVLKCTHTHTLRKRNGLIIKLMDKNYTYNHVFPISNKERN